MCSLVTFLTFKLLVPPVISIYAVSICTAWQFALKIGAYEAPSKDHADLRPDFVATQAVSPVVMVSGSDQFRRTLAGGL